MVIFTSKIYHYLIHLEIKTESNKEEEDIEENMEKLKEENIDKLKIKVRYNDGKMNYFR